MPESTGGVRSTVEGPGYRPRTIRSFVRREGRMTAAQSRALEAHLAGLAVPVGENLDLGSLFGRQAPTYLEIGSGNGECIAHLASKSPANDYIAVEVHRPGIGHLLNLALDAALTNLRVSTDDVHALLPRLPRESIAGVYIFFPDPWPKLRHHKRRLLQAEFFTALEPCLVGHGRVHIATDSLNYAEHLRDLFGALRQWRNLAGPSQTSPRLKRRPLTRFELRGIAAGRQIHDFTLARR
ncbi:MAG: tRNA (guanosine(46)-N7)-methyltransferase TrmB [Gammaproteobacteria bacterium]|nr:tRNA (guanosine(46)-N7)-methyltransferase TrmB [Gammaproteobacteria bacterium]